MSTGVGASASEQSRTSLQSSAHVLRHVNAQHAFRPLCQSTGYAPLCQSTGYARARMHVRTRTRTISHMAKFSPLPEPFHFTMQSHRNAMTLLVAQPYTLLTLPEYCPLYPCRPSPHRPLTCQKKCCLPKDTHSLFLAPSRPVQPIRRRACPQAQHWLCCPASSEGQVVQHG